MRRLAAGALLLAACAALADDWPAPRVREVFSASREHFVRVVPGKGGKHAAAEFYRRTADRSYRLVAEATLANPVAPVEAFVSDRGELATLDNWANAGYGAVVAIYDARGRRLRAYELKELFRAEQIESFPRSVSSIVWREGPSYIRGDQKTLLVTLRPGADLLFRLQTGELAK